MILTKIMVITAIGARQAESVTPIRAVSGATRVVPSFVCSHSPAHLSGKARAGAGRQRLKVPIRKELGKVEGSQGEGGAEARGCNFGARDSSFGPSLKKGTRWGWGDVCQQCPFSCNMATVLSACSMHHAAAQFAGVVVPLDGYWLHRNGSQMSVAHPRAAPQCPY